MLQKLLLYFVSLNIPSIYASCTVTRVIMRVPRENDIGLIFDLTISNRKKNKSELLDLTVNSNGDCTLNLTNGQTLQASTIFGGDFGSIEPGNSITVSLVWPTVSLYNRVGSCPIVITTANHQNEVFKTNQTLYFDTRFETLDPGNHTLRRRKDFIDCKNWDKNYLRNCTPLNCEERYFGKRSFYNRTTELCEPVPPCFGEGKIYDFYANECMDMNNFITDEEIEQLKQGKFDNNILDLQPYNTMWTPSEPDIKHTSHPRRQAIKECNFATKLSLIDFNNCFQHLKDPIVTETIATTPKPDVAKTLGKKSAPDSMLRSLYYDFFLPLNDEHDLTSTNDMENINVNNSTAEDDDSGTDEETNNRSLGAKITSGTLQMLSEYTLIELIMLAIKMLLIILLVIVFQFVLTFLTYIIVSTTIYTILVIIAYLKPYEVTADKLSKKLTPRLKLPSHEIMTSASLMSQWK
ncbi:uncharacterized protein LOC6572269 [Drosophila mojavensis]|uniref:Generative cell specific-1/HAP2 domain-containing protein n=1 Tax=Drosophila mojavensis TaxID=7230 RepID=B4KDN7_DROMO|nr:uncharacterized protein LOC6572269 [Drosophila mojavensis]EDW13871.2 uncharacterized protein Dmoj_GI23950 [Drosophila mojavensis]